MRLGQLIENVYHHASHEACFYNLLSDEEFVGRIEEFYADMRAAADEHSRLSEELGDPANDDATANHLAARGSTTAKDRTANQDAAATTEAATGDAAAKVDAALASDEALMYLRNKLSGLEPGDSR
jgi:hypothetical protein